jgi:hypothetical protein
MKFDCYYRQKKLHWYNKWYFLWKVRRAYKKLNMQENLERITKFSKII